jgi:hypothetical protein
MYNEDQVKGQLYNMGDFTGQITQVIYWEEGVMRET